MTTADDRLTRVRGFNSEVDGLTSGFGGVLRCGTCGAETAPKGRYWREGWPKCHGLTMTWWTARQIAAGEDRTP